MGRSRVGCGAVRVRGGRLGAWAAGAARTLSVAARQGDAAALYAMSERHRRAESLEAFRARLSGNSAELAALGESVTLALGGGGGPQAEVALRDRTAVTLVGEPEGWRVGDPGLVRPWRFGWRAGRARWRRCARSTRRLSGGAVSAGGRCSRRARSAQRGEHEPAGRGDGGPFGAPDERLPLAGRPARFPDGRLLEVGCLRAGAVGAWTGFATREGTAGAAATAPMPAPSRGGAEGQVCMDAVAPDWLRQPSTWRAWMPGPAGMVLPSRRRRRCGPRSWCDLDARRGAGGGALAEGGVPGGAAAGAGEEGRRCGALGRCYRGRCSPGRRSNRCR